MSDTTTPTPTSSTTPESSADDGPAVREIPSGIDVKGHLVSSGLRAGLTPAQAVAVAETFVADLQYVDSLRDDAGRVWSLIPVLDAEGRALPFDARNAGILREAAANVLTFSPEAVAVFAGVAYPSTFRDAKIDRVVWLGRGGEVVAVPDVFNSLDAVAMLHEAMFVRLQQVRLHEQRQVGELLARKKELYEQQATAAGRPAPPQGEAAGQAGAGQGP